MKGNYYTMKKVLLVIGVTLILTAVAAIDPLAEVKQEIEDLKARVEYLERFIPIDTFEQMTGPGSSIELAADLNQRVIIADNIALAVTQAELITKASEIKLLPEEIKPKSSGVKLLALEVTIHNTGEWGGMLRTGDCPWETHDTFATDYWGDCEQTTFWNVVVDDREYPVIGTLDWGRVYNYSNSRMYFHISSGNPMHGILTYKHPGNENSHRYWKIQRNRR